MPAAVDNVSADWHEKGRRGALRLLKALADQVGGNGRAVDGVHPTGVSASHAITAGISLAVQPGGFCVGSAPPKAAAALQSLLSRVCGDIALVASLPPEVTGGLF